MNTAKKGFTLIELLVVIAIVAVLAVTVILTLNPAQLLRQARDSNRTQDLATLKSALSLYLADVATPVLGTSTNCYAHTSSSMATCATNSRFAAGSVILRTSLAIDSNGWIPVNSTTYFYAYRADNTNQTFEINADMESTKFGSGGSSDVEGTDGGNSATLHETGTDPGLDL